MFSWLKKHFKKDATPPSKETRIVLAPPNYDLTVSMQSDVGCLRDVNEDCGRYIQPGTPALVAQKGVLALVADGMGGHLGGEVASRMVADGLGGAYYEQDGAPHAALQAAFEQINHAIYQAAAETEELRGMGTTCTALVLRGNEAFCAHVGDSRLYLIRGGELKAMSEDHSLVHEMVKQGLLTEEEARTHEDRNVITRALGLHPTVAVTTWEAPFSVHPHDRFLLCSDGLYDLVTDEEILEIVAAEAPHIATERLVVLAKERGGHDNITVGVLSLRPVGPSPISPERDTREIEVTP